MNKLFNKKTAGLLFGIAAIWRILSNLIIPVIKSIVWKNGFFNMIELLLKTNFDFGNILMILGLAALAAYCLLSFDEKISKIICISGFGAVALSTLVSYSAGALHQIKAMFTGMPSTVISLLTSLLTSSFIAIVLIAACVFAVLGFILKKKVFYTIAAILGAAYILVGALGSASGILEEIFRIIERILYRGISGSVIGNFIYVLLNSVTNFINYVLIGGSVAVLSFTNMKAEQTE